MARSVLVTGGGTGIGRAIAAWFVADGEEVLITGRRTKPLQDTAAELGARVRFAVCDGADPAAVDALRPELPERVDVLVNNAGGNTDFDHPPAKDLKGLAEAWRVNLEANLLSAVLMTELVRDRITDGASVVNIGSIAADKGNGAYGAAKAGLAAWNIGLSRELGPTGVTTNVVSPGYIGDTEFFRDQLTDTRREALIAATDTKRPGAPDDIAGTVAFLASPAARQITGQLLAVNGGEHPTR
jgi:3-oxoacyl-[acyl-carrier protein] reductase